MANVTATDKRDSDDVLHVRVGELKPLVKKWRIKNPKRRPSDLLRKGLKLALKPYATKKQAAELLN